MKRHLVIALLALLCALPAYAAPKETPPDQVVKAFYKDYLWARKPVPQIEGKPTTSWLSRLLQKQSDNMDKTLRDYFLRLSIAQPGLGQPVLEVDPLVNSQQWTTGKFMVKKPVMKDGLAYVPVFAADKNGKGQGAERARVVLRNMGYGWKIANLVYPAQDGKPAWDLLSHYDRKFNY